MNHDIIAQEIVTDLEKAVANNQITRAQHLFTEAEELDWTKVPETTNARYRSVMDQLHSVTS